MPNRRYISHRHGIEYISVEKAACTSIKAALLMSDGIEPPAKLIDLHHHPHWQMGGAVTWIFSFVRHPLERLVSLYCDMVRTGRSREFMASLPASTSFGDFVRWIAMQRGVPNRHCAPQSLLVTLGANRRPIDFIGHVETIEEDWRVVQDHAPGLGELPHMNSCDKPEDWRRMYDEDTLAIARAYYAADFWKWPEYEE